jgi:hypothetical protein
MRERSALMLHFLRQLPTAVVPIVAVLLLIGGLALRGAIGGVCLLVIAFFLGWLAYMSWPSLDLRGRSLRVLALILMLAIAALQFTR